MKKSAIVLVFAMALSFVVRAQSIQEGVNNFYAERYGSAKSIFDKLLASNPNNIEATYWLGQTYLAQENLSGAKSLYEKALASNGNAPLFLAGMGHVELLEGNKTGARQHFEQAITASKGRKGADPVVLTAIGRANVDAYSDAKRNGDLDYAIAKLNEAAQIAPNNPDVFLTLGNAYRKKHLGGEAVQAYRKAGNFAPAIYRTAMLYQTQSQPGQGYSDIVLENLNNAISADPRFAPAYEQLYYYNLLYKKDFATAETFATKYISNSDPSVENDYLKAQTDFVQKKFSDAVNIGKNIISQTNNNAKPRVYRLMGYSYLELKDTTTACQFVNDFFKHAKDEDIIGEDYLLHATACGKNDPEIIRTDVYKAVQIDSVLSRQIGLLTKAATDAKNNNQRVLEAELNKLSFDLRKPDQRNATELINGVALPYFFGGAYQKADSAAKAYIAIAPDSIWGHYWSALALASIDTSMEQGLAMPAYQKVLDIAATDKVRFKSQGVRAAQTLAIYSFNIKNDKAAAAAYVQKGLEFDPTNANLKNIEGVLNAKPSAPAKNNSGSSGGATKEKTKTGTTKVKKKG
ncbi:tetratricopeptide repeat protein [Flavisolibacter ginsengisoli]|jgi:tetratricopeptide (TPR) repeat protein|uniref:Tetratricopeptide repeat-containing protein n=1 Tax=Flavisolibacter ginsengisoli DSM 18119 TaxID=1121884 RepID=A0A1M5AST7_9BACT|nr:tetratricopeptide repeat protein [Flavisolibacter ginsengisoli]SHF33206.1 Tetratricopeptide repeat-containing protein [Flavisolibacter ginsengisoli DSM 18119]